MNIMLLVYLEDVVKQKPVTIFTNVLNMLYNPSKEVLENTVFFSQIWSVYRCFKVNLLFQSIGGLSERISAIQQQTSRAIVKLVGVSPDRVIKDLLIPMKLIFSKVQLVHYQKRAIVDQED